MGLFDFFMSEEKQLQRHQRRITNRDSQPEDREASARWLSEKGTPPAMMAMLSRFDINLEHQLKDAGEKEFVYSLLAGHGSKAVDAVRSWLRQCRQFALPLRLLADLSGQEAAVQMAFEILEIERKKDDFKTDKKKGLLIWLAEMRHAGIPGAAAPFLADFDEGVRFAAIEAVAAQAGDAGREGLIAVLANPREESNRLRIRVAEVVAQRGWRIDDASLAERLPPGFLWRDGRIFKS